MSNVVTVAQFPTAGKRKDNFRSEIRSFARRLRKFNDSISAFVERHGERLDKMTKYDLELTIESIGDSGCMLRDIICDLDGV